MQRIRAVAISLASVAALGALAACSDQLPSGLGETARRSTAPDPRSSAAAVAPITQICSNATTTTVLYSGSWVDAFLTDLSAVNASYPGAYAAPLNGSAWISPTPTSGVTADPGVYYFRTTFDLPAAGAFTNAAISGGLVHADNGVTTGLNGIQIFQHADPIDGLNMKDPAESFSATTGFMEGTNTVTFDLFNQSAATPNPAALNFCFTVDYTAVVPLPTWPFGGFLEPVDNLPTVNLAKSGSAIPVKFSLGGDRGLDIFASGSPSTLSFACNSSLQTNAIEETVTTTSSGLSYDAATDVYQLVWKSDKSWMGSCRQLSLKFSDGSEYRATFQFR